ncbi:MAG: hypothetical protein QY325_09655 [Flavobacteriales bacterium]|nr:MAG: hypothetical protein QY325_09655 [Flavobacteriales bacterium]
MNTSITTHDRHDLMRAAVLVAAAFCIPYTTHAQNLVPNPGFEETDSCWHTLGLGALQDWYSAFLTPDHLQNCLPYGSVNGIPMNLWTYQQPYEGNSCVGIFTYHTDGSSEQREWIMVPLLEPMAVGQTYYCSFRMNAAFGGNAQYPQIWLANSNVGMLFTTYNGQWNGGDPYPAALNQAHVRYTQVLTDTVGWTLVSGSFAADSAYQYLMIGNFFSNALTDTLHFADPNSVFPWYPRGYTLIDAVCVSPNPAGCDLGQGVGEEGADSPVLFPNPAHDQLVVGRRTRARLVAMDAVGRVVWHGMVESDRWVLPVGAWARGAYVLRLEWSGRTEVHKFVLAE